MKSRRKIRASMAFMALFTLIAATGFSESSSAEKAPRKTPDKVVTVGQVNINTANTAELTQLPGVGVVKAERIVAFRKRVGKFRRIKDLRRVKGFGYKSLKKLTPHLTLTGPTTVKK